MKIFNKQFHFYKFALKWQHNTLFKIFVKPWYDKIAEHKRKQRNRRLHEIGPQLMELIFSSLRENDITCWLEFGSLLGACREHDFIAHDEDIDIGAFYNDRDKIQEIFKSKGILLKHQFEVKGNPELGFEQTYIYNGLTVDIMYFHKDSDKEMHCNTFGAFNSDYQADYIPVKEISVPYSGFKQIAFKGTSVNIPFDWKLHLSAHYGPNFMIPDSKFDYRKDATNIKYYTREEREGLFSEFPY